MSKKTQPNKQTLIKKMTYLKQLHYFKCYIRWHLYRGGGGGGGSSEKRKKVDREPVHRRKGASASQVTWKPTHVMPLTVRNQG